MAVRSVWGATTVAAPVLAVFAMLNERVLGAQRLQQRALSFAY